jgi:hypothetical protein
MMQTSLLPIAPPTPKAIRPVGAPDPRNDPRYITVKPLTDEQVRELARLQNRRTMYEIEIAVGAQRALLCYSESTSVRQIIQATETRQRAVLAFLGMEGPIPVERVKGRQELRIAGAVIRPTGRTRRDVIMAGDPLPYIGKLHPNPEGT